MHVAIAPYFTVPKGKMDEFKAAFGKFYDGTRARTKECLYYGFAAHGNAVHCREDYKNAESVLAYLGDVRAPLDAAVAMVGKSGLNLAVMGLASELAKLRGTMGPWAPGPHPMSASTMALLWTATRSSAAKGTRVQLASLRTSAM